MGRSAGQHRGRQFRNMVISMDDEARRAAFAEAKARSLETLERVADVTVEHRDHSGEYWERPKPAPVPTPQPRSPTVAEIEMQRSRDWTAFVDSRIEHALAERAWRDEARMEATGKALGEIRKQLRAEIQEQIGLLRADITIEKAAERREADVVELPQFLGKRNARSS
jgi:hypothetical protein